MNTSAKKRCAFLTMDETEGWSIDADLAIAPLQKLGWQVDSVPWREKADWGVYDAVYIGTPWDYPHDAELFLAALERIEQAGAALLNPLSLVRWNLQKTYLRDLEQQGAVIVPTIWLDKLGAADLENLFKRCGSKQIIIKPTVSTNATDTYLLARAMTPTTQKHLLETFAARACMAQPFIAAIQTEGEFSLFFIGGEFSHAIQKCPKPRDFRVQEEHGASITSVQPEANILQTARQIMSLVSPVPLYARVDLVRDSSNRYLLMELEMIEPSMYLRMDDAAPERFASAFDRYASTRK